MISSRAAAQFEACAEDMRAYHRRAILGVLAREQSPPSLWLSNCYYSAEDNDNMVVYELELHDPLSLRLGEDIIREFVGSSAVLETEIYLDGCVNLVSYRVGWRDGRVA